jgi:hypothetical protein
MYLGLEPAREVPTEIEEIESENTLEDVNVTLEELIGEDCKETGC